MLLFYNDSAGDPRAAGGILGRRIRQVLVRKFMDDESAAITVEQRVQATGERHSARDGVERTFSVTIDGQILQIPEMIGMIAETRIHIGLRIHLRIDVAVIMPLGG